MTEAAATPQSLVEALQHLLRPRLAGQQVEATVRDGNLHEPVERQLPREEAEKPLFPKAKEAEDRKGEPPKETDGTEQTGRTPGAPAKKEQEKRQ